MTENDPQLPDKIRRALKESPSLTPPESFYRGVLQKIERKKTRAQEPAPWFWGYPAKALAAACVLVVMVLVTRETRQSKPELFQFSIEAGNKSSEDKNLPLSAPAPANPANEKTAVAGKLKSRREKIAEGPDLADTKEVQDQLHRSISSFVGSPSPFEEVDAQAKKDLSANLKKNQSVPVMQARDTVNGAATQGSFNQEQQAFGNKQAAAKPASHAAPVDDLLKIAETAQEWKGWISGIATFQTVVIKTSGEWQSLWRDHAGYVVPPPPLPDVDFTKVMVVGIFDGTKPTAGYSVDIIDVQMLPDSITVLYRETKPAAGMVTAQILTQPYHLRLIPRSERPVLFKRSEAK
jgi:hypothetical protein